MIKNILIHIGYQKTASTWLQKEVFTSYSNIFVPLSFSKEGHSTLAEHFFKDKDGYLLSSFDNNYMFLKKQIETIKNIQEKDINHKIPVISHERLSGNINSGGFDAKVIAHRLKNIFPDAKILIIIREQNSIILSIYFQYLVNGGRWSLKKYLLTKYDGKYPFFSPNHLNYLPLVQYYYKLFGKKNVLVLPYEMLRDKPSMFIDHIGNFINVPLKAENYNLDIVWNKTLLFYIRHKFRFLNSFRRNNSLNTCHIFSNDTTEFFINLFFHMANKFVPKHVEIKFIEQLKNQIHQFIKRRYYHSNKELSSQINIDLGEYGYF